MFTKINTQMGLKFFSFFALGMLLNRLTSLAPPPEKTTALFPTAAYAFGVFILFVIGLLSGGSLIRRALKFKPFSDSESALFDLTVGSILVYYLSYFLTGINLFSSSQAALLWIILAACFSFASVSVYSAALKRWFKSGKGWFPKTLMAIPVLIIFSKLLEGLQFHQHGDAYVTYLPAPRSWAALGNFSEYIKFMQYFLTTSWESLYAFGTVLMGLQGAAGLDATQWFAQWCTGGIAVSGILLASTALSHRLAEKFPLNKDWFPIIALFSIQVPVLRWTQNLAKHDFGVAFWGVAAFYFATYLLPLSLPLAFITGVITGTAVIGKLTVGILGVCIGVGVICRSFNKTFNSSFKSFIFFSLGGVVGILPVIMRNLATTGSPLFPWFPRLFPSSLNYLSASMLAGAERATGTHFEFSNSAVYLQEIISNLPLLFSLIIMAAFIFVRAKKNKIKVLSDYLKFLLIPFVTLIGFTVAFRPSTEIRYQGPTLVILASLSAYFSFYLIQEIIQLIYKKETKAAWRVNAVFAIILIATANLTFFTFTQIGSAKFQPISKKLSLIQGTGGLAKLWIRQNLIPTEPLLAVGDSHPYFLIDYNMTDTSSSVEFDTLIFDQTAEDAEKLLLAAPFRYLYLATDASFSIYKKTIIEIIARSNKWNQKCKFYEDPTAQVWDLFCLKGKM